MRTEIEMQHTLKTLELIFHVDVTDAQDLHGEALANWLEKAEKELFENLSTFPRATGNEKSGRP